MVASARSNTAAWARRLVHPRSWPVRWRLASVSSGLTLVILVIFGGTIGQIATTRVRFVDDQPAGGRRLVTDVVRYPGKPVDSHEVTPPRSRQDAQRYREVLPSRARGHGVRADRLGLLLPEKLLAHPRPIARHGPHFRPLEVIKANNDAHVR